MERMQQYLCENVNMKHILCVCTEKNQLHEQTNDQKMKYRVAFDHTGKQCI